MLLGQIVPDIDAATALDIVLICPALKGIPRTGASALAMLPATSLNLESLRFIQRPRVAVSNQFTGFYFADPFVDFSRVFMRMLSGSIGGVCNWPSSGIHGGGFARELDDCGLGFDSEVEVVKRAVDAGMDVLATAFTLPQAELMLQAGARKLLLHGPLGTGALAALPVLDDWLWQFADLKNTAGVTLIAYAEVDSHAAAQWRSTMANGILTFGEVLAT